MVNDHDGGLIVNAPKGIFLLSTGGCSLTRSSCLLDVARSVNAGMLSRCPRCAWPTPTVTIVCCGHTHSTAGRQPTATLVRTELDKKLAGVMLNGSMPKARASLTSEELCLEPARAGIWCSPRDVTKRYDGQDTAAFGHPRLAVPAKT